MIRFNADFSRNVFFHATRLKGDVLTSELQVGTLSGGGVSAAWHGSFTGEQVSAVLPTKIVHSDLEGFIITTRGMAGNRYRVIVVLLGAKSRKLYLNEIGIGVPSFPEIAYDADGNPVISLRAPTDRAAAGFAQQVVCRWSKHDGLFRSRHRREAVSRGM